MQKMTTLTIATWNLNRPAGLSSLRTTEILKQITAINADIWVLTETNTQITLPGYTALATPVTSQRRPDERTTMIWSRWPLEVVAVFPDLPEQDAVPPTWPSYTTSSRATSPAVCAKVAMPGGPILVYGTVIAHFGDRGQLGVSAYHQEQFQSIEAHRCDWHRLRKDHPTLPLIVAGDFNATCDSRNYPSKAICDAMRTALTASDLFCVSQEHWIDHICLSTPHYRSSQVYVKEPWYFSPRSNQSVPLSDHHYVVATLEVVSTSE